MPEIGVTSKKDICGIKDKLYKYAKPLKWASAWHH